MVIVHIFVKVAPSTKRAAAAPAAPMVATPECELAWAELELSVLGARGLPDRAAVGVAVVPEPKCLH